MPAVAVTEGTLTARLTTTGRVYTRAEDAILQNRPGSSWDAWEEARDAHAHVVRECFRAQIPLAHIQPHSPFSSDRLNAIYLGG